MTLSSFRRTHPARARLLALSLGLVVLPWTAALAQTPTAATPLTVSGAASLGPALRALAPLFEAQHPGTRLQFNLAASGQLLQQIAQGAPVDVFASADQATMDQAQARQLVVAAERRNIVSNALVLVVPAAARQVPTTLKDLATPAYARIAIGLPASVPVGRYTQQVLEAAGLWTAIAPKMIGAQNVRQALDYVARAEVDAGFVYATDAKLLPGPVKLAFAVPTPQPVLYPAAPVAASTQPQRARAFVQFLLSPAAQQVLAEHGFGPP